MATNPPIDVSETLRPSSIVTLGELTNLDQSDKVRVLAMLTTSRTADLPDVPTFTQGYRI